MKFKQMIKKYLDYSFTSKARGTWRFESTICSYLLKYLNYDAHNLSTDDVRGFVADLKKRTKLSNKSINKCIKQLKQVLKFHNIENNAVQAFPLLKERKQRFEMLQKKEQEVVFKYINATTGPNAEQYRLMIYLLWDTGIRQNELLNIEISNIRIESKTTLLTKTKCNIDRMVVMSSLVTEKVNEFIKGRSRKYLFYNNIRGRMFSAHDLKLFYRRMKKATGISKIHSHMFRHTVATELIEAGAPLDVVQLQLGHQSLTTTQEYLHQSMKRQCDIIGSIKRM